ncbi:TPA: uracil-DNA glycosylase [Legionella pneumophila]|nr:uracil-DNA glycosylase [Legionella pneumophila]HAU2265640.1 uracil-DNA glycosylase [Legionella pneumophila]
MYENLLVGCHEEWKEILMKALNTMDSDYLKQIQEDSHWLPGLNQLFSAFSLPLSQTQYILLGESPYPRKISANGYAFWDNSVGLLWSSTGLSKEVNRATSLRNWIKTLLIARGDLHGNTSQEAIAKINKSCLVQTAEDFFKGMMKKGILLLNASLVYSKGKVPYHARHWKSFMQNLFEQLAIRKPDVQLILFGKIAEKIPANKLLIGLVSEHPYNVSFITNQRVIEFFKPMDLLSYESN